MNVGDRTCAACDGPLGGSLIRVAVGGKPVEVCSSVCAEALNEACVAGLPKRRATSGQQAALTVRSIETLSGRISYSEAGSGAVALFVHGMLLNKHFWRHQLAGLFDIRRCIAVDLLAHGETEIEANQNVSSEANANMLKEMLDALQIDKVDLIGNHTGGGVVQIFAALHPERVRSLTLTNCDAHDNWPPVAFEPFLDRAAAGGLRDMLNEILADKAIYRSPSVLGLAYEPDKVSDEDIEIYLRPLVRTEQRARDLQRFLAAFDHNSAMAVEAQLKEMRVPTLIVWAIDDVYFPVKWAYWLAETIPGAKPPVELPGAHVFFPEERSELFNQLLRDELLAGVDADIR
jgi:pimeloyl-ACP methyl ester carboxylesterase